MKILFISSARQPDYQCDMLLHGLRICHGENCIDSPRVAFLYQDYCDVPSLYGKGFSLYCLLPEIEIDRSHIRERIRAKEFDLVIYGSIQRSQEYFDLVVANYPREKVIFIDGEDHPNFFNLTKHGLYFKRELQHSVPGVYPIHFAIPRQKVSTIKPVIKDQVRARIDPRDRSTYIYEKESDYYQEYSRSLFAFTMRKAGWDALRHLEIMANGCIPLFLDIADCPEQTCTHLPKPELIEALTYAEKDGTFWDTPEGKAIWKSLHRRIHQQFIKTSLTENLAQYVLDIQQREEAKAA